MTAITGFDIKSSLGQYTNAFLLIHFMTTLSIAVPDRINLGTLKTMIGREYARKTLDWKSFQQVVTICLLLVRTTSTMVNCPKATFHLVSHFTNTRQ